MSEEFREFTERVWGHYREHGRDDLPWRDTTDPYAVLVSEVMLQQTQVARVVPKFAEFLDVFPDVHTLAAAPLDDVIRAWRGLGYNRRALSLRRAAATIVGKHDGRVPDTLEGLVALPGIGHATAAQVLAFAYNVGVPFIETNVRSVYLHEFFRDAEDVPDAALLPLVAATFDHDRPREWFWALMDYGSHLKATVPNPSRRSRHHTRQGRFEGSSRQLRGRLLAVLAEALGAESGVTLGGVASATPVEPPGLSAEALTERVAFPTERVTEALAALQAEGFVSCVDGRWRIG